MYLLLAVLYTIAGVSMDSLKFTVAGIRTVIELTFKMAGAHDSEQMAGRNVPSIGTCNKYTTAYETMAKFGRVTGMG